MARMMGRAHRNSKNTKAECKCGRRMCSNVRAFARREQRRIEKHELARQLKKGEGQ